MTRENILLILKALGVSRISEGKQWISCECPFSSVTHRSGRDKHPSFNIRIDDKGPSIYYCYTCSDKYRRLWHFFKKYREYFGTVPEEAERIYKNTEITGGYNGIISDEERDQPIDVWSRYYNRDKIKGIPNFVLDRFPLMEESDKSFDYIVNVRGISPEAIKAYKVRVFRPDSTMIFPMTDINGNILILQARTIIGSQKALYITSEYLGIENIAHLPTVSEAGAWFGMDIINWKEPVLIVEGCFDAMKAYTFGFKNCIAPFGSSITEAQINSLIGGSYLIGLDSDDSGKQGAIKLIKKLIRKNTISYVNWSTVNAKDVGEISDINSFWYAINKRKVIYS